MIDKNDILIYMLWFELKEKCSLKYKIDDEYRV